MTRFARWGFALALLPLAACSSGPTQMASMQPPPPMMPPMAQADSTFAMAAANSDMTEIRTSQIALQKARRPAVRQFAQQMIDHHQQSSQRLMSIGQSKGMMPPSSLDAQSQAMVDGLTNAPAGPRFEREYLRGQVTSHQQTLQTMQAYAANGTDPELRAFAAEMAPVVQGHLTAAQRLSGMRPARPARG